MKQLKKILIITDDEELSPSIAKLVAEVLSSMKLSAYFYYAKTLDEALAYKQEKMILSYYYDVIFFAVKDSSLRIYDVIDNIQYGLQKNLFFFLSPSEYLIERARTVDEIELSFLLTEQLGLASRDNERVKSCILSELISK